MVKKHSPSYIRRQKGLSPREGPSLIKEGEDMLRTKAILFRLTPNEKAVLKEIADSEDMTVIALIREMIRDSITT